MSAVPPLAENQEQRPVKSETAFRTIGEVFEELDVPQHVLRFWETRFSQVRPLKRAGGRRYYRPEDVALLKRIRDLLYRDGLTIKGVRKLLHEHGTRAVLAGEAGAQALWRDPNHDSDDENGENGEDSETGDKDPLKPLETPETHGAGFENATSLATRHGTAPADALRTIIADLEALRRELVTALGQMPLSGTP